MSAGQVKAPPTARQFGYPSAPLHRIPYLSFPSSPFPHLPGQHKAAGAGEGPTRQATQCCSCHPGLPGFGAGGAPERLLKPKPPLSLPGTRAPPRRHAWQCGDVPAVPQMGFHPCCHPYSSGGPCTSQRRHRSPSPTALPSKPACSPRGALVRCWQCSPLRPLFSRRVCKQPACPACPPHSCHRQGNRTQRIDRSAQGLLASSQASRDSRQGLKASRDSEGRDSRCHAGGRDGPSVNSSAAPISPLAC